MCAHAPPRSSTASPCRPGFPTWAHAPERHCFRGHVVAFPNGEEYVSDYVRKPGVITLCPTLVLGNHMITGPADGLTAALADQVRASTASSGSHDSSGGTALCRLQRSLSFGGNIDKKQEWDMGIQETFMDSACVERSCVAARGRTGGWLLVEEDLVRDDWWLIADTGLAVVHGIWNEEDYVMVLVGEDLTVP